MSRGPYAAQPSARWRWLRRVPVLISGLWEALHTIFALFEFTDVILTLLSYCTNTVLLTLLLLGKIPTVTRYISSISPSSGRVNNLESNDWSLSWSLVLLRAFRARLDVLR